MRDNEEKSKEINDAEKERERKGEVGRGAGRLDKPKTLVKHEIVFRFQLRLNRAIKRQL